MTTSNENSTSTTPTNNNNFVSSCRILWSTQSGRAKACARRTARILKEQTELTFEGGAGSPFDEVDFIDLVTNTTTRTSSESSFFLLFVSTTGDGEHCDSIVTTWKLLLQKSLASKKSLFRNKKFVIFCLGDRAYGPQFCAAGRKLAIRLLQLGMTNLVDVGYGDDTTPNGGVFFDLDIWLEQTLLPYLTPIRRERPISVSTADQVSTTIRSPYRIEIKSTTTINTTNSSSPKSKEEGKEWNNGEEEWLDSCYKEAYQDYFTLSCPISSYSYSPDTKHRLSPTSNNSIGNNEHFPLQGHVVSNERITATDWEQDTRHIQIQFFDSVSAKAQQSSSSKNDLHEESLPYLAGDIATILPCNSDKEVHRFLQVVPERLQQLATRGDTISVKIDEQYMNNSFVRWPDRCTLCGWLKYCADIHSLPEREDLRALSFYCSLSHERGKDQKEKLIAMSETKGAALYADYILREKRSWTDVLYDFDSLRDSNSGITFESLLALLPPIRPRHFSIASAPSTRTMNETTESTESTSRTPGFAIELCVAVVEGTTPLGRTYHGLCSDYLSRLVPSSDYKPIVRVWIRPGTFSGLPLQVVTDNNIPTFETPILCIGAGTGIAPLRSLIMERDAILSQMCQNNDAVDTETTIDENNNIHDNILVFGCRKRLSDYYYQSDWQKIVSSGSRRLRVLTAFSRDQPHKIYVQKVLGEADDSCLICQHILKRNGAVYIAGGPQMARWVKEEIVSSLGKELGSEKRASQFLVQLQRSGKFSVEAWS